MTNSTIESNTTGRWSHRKSLFIVVVGAAIGWVAAIVSVYGVLRSIDGDDINSTPPALMVSDEDYQDLSEIAPAAGETEDQQNDNGRKNIGTP